jgi:hypothetical protein
MGHHEAVVSADPWPDRMPVPAFGPRMVCTRWGIIGAAEAREKRKAAPETTANHLREEVLTHVRGGAFGNDDRWIDAAMRRALEMMWGFARCEARELWGAVASDPANGGRFCLNRFQGCGWRPADSMGLRRASSI